MHTGKEAKYRRQGELEQGGLMAAGHGLRVPEPSRETSRECLIGGDK
jgi:hypothetical protein